jgi:anaerobic selenocysteine-containing dehydrogenase
MAPPQRPINQKRNAWHLSGYDPDQFEVHHELTIGKRVIQMGDSIKIKNKRGEFTFRAIVRNLATDKVWVDCLHPNLGWSSFYLDQIKGPAPKRRVRKS